MLAVIADNMATLSTYYIDTPVFKNAIAVFLDPKLTTLAPDGYYSFGGIVRRQLNGRLLASVDCPSCVNPPDTIMAATLAQGVYYIDVNTGIDDGDIGAVVVELTISGGIAGFLATMGSDYYNDITSVVQGSLKADSRTRPTYIGETTNDCGSSGQTYSLNVFEYTDGAFAATSLTEDITVNAGDLELTSGNPGFSVIVIPKPYTTPSVVRLKIIVPCAAASVSLNSYINSPEVLEYFSSSESAVSDDLACALSLDKTYYRMDMSSSPGEFQLGDRVYADPFGVTNLDAGYYNVTGMSVNYDWIQLDADGVVVNKGDC